MTVRSHALSTAVLVFCAQLLLAWHAPSHLESADSGPLTLINASDCEICLPGPGAAPVPHLPESLPSPASDQAPITRQSNLPREASVPDAGPRAPPVLS